MHKSIGTAICRDAARVMLSLARKSGKLPVTDCAQIRAGAQIPSDPYQEPTEGIEEFKKFLEPDLARHFTHAQLVQLIGEFHVGSELLLG